MHKRTLLFLLLLISSWTMVLGTVTQSPQQAFKLSMKVVDAANNEPIIMGNIQLKPLGSSTVTDADGNASISNIPQGEYQVSVSYVGYVTYTTNVKLTKDTHLAIRLRVSDLSLKEVVVTAKQNAMGTVSTIGRQAIDHLQASSLADVMQLLPGQIIKNTDLTSQTNLQLRTLVNNNTSAFGSSIVLDGMPMSNNGTVSQGGFSSTAFTGTDLRQISADDIDNVEVIRGIPSAEYGDLTSGLVLVHSKAGVTPWQVKAKINPELQNYSLGKGTSLGRAGILNVSVDYVKAWSDPRMRTRSYHRWSANTAWSYNLSKIWHIDTRIRMMQTSDWSGKDPDAVQDGSETKNDYLSLGLTHNGKIRFDKLFSRTLSYTFGVNYVRQDSRNTGFVTVSSGLQPIITAMATGYYPVAWATQSYQATGKTESRPGNIFAKINNNFYLKLGKTRQSFKVGAEYHYDWNSGKGYYNLDESKPLRPNSNGRPRAFSDIPGLHQVAAYAEDNFVWSPNRVNRLRAQLGLRFTTLQPFSDLSTTALSPRVNLTFDVTRWLALRAGIGLNSKTPGLNYLYPDKKYDDRIAANYMPQGTDAAVQQLLVYHTQVYDVKRSKGLKNATTTKIEAGADIKLPWGGKMSILAYHDKTPNGFGSATEYITYQSMVFDATHGLNITPGAATTIDYSNPARTDLVFMTTGKIGNTNTTINKGLEFDFDLGTIRAINTSFYYSGACSETKTFSTDLNAANVKNSLLTSDYTAYGLTPFKVVYPSGEDYDLYRQYVSTVRIVTNIPSLKMVASLTGQAIWQTYSWSYLSSKSAIGYIGTDLGYHAITQDMQGGYLDYAGQYYATKPAGINSISIADLALDNSDNVPTKSKPTWNISARLTKQLGNIGGLSLYVNNVIFYEPYKVANNNTKTLVQRNSNNFSYGVELYFNL
jgi:outer membrane cobalamin receptor